MVVSVAVVSIAVLYGWSTRFGFMLRAPWHSFLYDGCPLKF